MIAVEHEMTDNGGENDSSVFSVVNWPSSVNTSDDSSGNETSWIEWDDWDESLWTPEQKQMLEQGVIPYSVHVLLGILLILIVLFGVIANSTILYVFSR